jgi:hypothetical protein
MACFENIAIEDLDACINSASWSIRGGVYYGVHAHHSPNAIERK